MDNFAELLKKFIYIPMIFILQMTVSTFLTIFIRIRQPQTTR